MNPTNPPTVTPQGLYTFTTTVVAVLLGLLMLSPITAEAQTADDPTSAFCQAWADYQNAQDGAELNTALGEMQNALTAGAPAEVADALVTLGQGDLDPAEVQAASDVVAAWADEPCAELTTSTTAGGTTSIPDDSDDGETPTGGVDTGAGGTATDGGPISLGLVVAFALVTGVVGATVLAGRRRVGDCR